MGNIICGDTEFNGKKYKFDYRNNVLVLIPETMEKYIKWRLEHLEVKEKNDYVNLEGITNNGYYICFIHVRLSEIGSGALQSFVPGYAICKANGISPVPRLENIEKITLFGDCLDKFYYPKKIIDYNDIFSPKLRLELDKENNKLRKFSINKDTYAFGVRWNIPHSSNINQVLDVYSYLDVKFNEKKDINQIVDYYLNIKKFFSFINNRKYIKFEKIFAYKKELVDYGIGEEKNIRETTIEFELYFVDPDEEFDIDKSLNAIRLEDIEDEFTKLYKKVTNKEFLTQYYPLSKKDDEYINNEKFANVASAFESEFNKLFPRYKSDVCEEYKEVKKIILKTLSNKKGKSNRLIEKNENEEEMKYLKNVIRQCNYFSKIIGKIEGTLEEKIIYSYDRYSYVINKARQNLMKNYNIKRLRNGILASKFAKRRNDISHGNYTESFDETEIIAYELIRICIYSLTFERCGFSNEKIKTIVDKIF